MKKFIALSLIVVILLAVFAACTRYIPFYRIRPTEPGTSCPHTCTPEQTDPRPPDTLPESQRDTNGFYWVIPPIIDTSSPYGAMDIARHVLYRTSLLPTGSNLEIAVRNLVDRENRSSYWMYDPELNKIARVLWGVNTISEHFFPFPELLYRFPEYKNTFDLVIQVILPDYQECCCDSFGGIAWPYPFLFATIYGGQLITEFRPVDDMRGCCCSGFSYNATHASQIIGNTAWGIINNRGEYALPFIFDKIIFIDDYHAFVRINEYYGIMDVARTLEVGAFQNQSFEPDENGLVWMIPPTLEFENVLHGDWESFFAQLSNGDYVHINVNTGETTPIDWIYEGDLDIAFVGYDPILNYFLARGIANGKPVHRNEIRHWVWPGTSDELWHLTLVQKISIDFDSVMEYGTPNIIYFDQFALFRGLDQLTEFIFNGYSGVPNSFFSNIITAQLISTEMWGMFDASGSIVLPFIFEHIIFIDNCRAFVKIDGLYGVMHVGKTLQNLNSGN